MSMFEKSRIFAASFMNNYIIRNVRSMDWKKERNVINMDWKKKQAASCAEISVEKVGSGAENSAGKVSSCAENSAGEVDTCAGGGAGLVGSCVDSGGGKATLILDLGGVIMQHNIPGCKARFEELLGTEAVAKVLGMDSHAEGQAHSLMEQYEVGLISTDAFVDTLLGYARPGTTADDIRRAWLLMHAGIPEERRQMLRTWKQKGHRLFLLSNNNDLHWTDVQTRYDLSMFDHCFASHLLHCAKPGREIFAIVDTYLRTHGLPQPYLFVDDLEANRLAAAAFGWQTFESMQQVDCFIRG